MFFVQLFGGWRLFFFRGVGFSKIWRWKNCHKKNRKVQWELKLITFQWIISPNPLELSGWIFIGQNHHPCFVRGDGETGGHTTFKMCDQKGAGWWNRSWEVSLELHTVEGLMKRTWWIFWKPIPLPEHTREKGLVWLSWRKEQFFCWSAIFKIPDQSTSKTVIVPAGFRRLSSKTDVNTLSRPQILWQNV